MFDFDVVTGPAGLTAPQKDHQEPHGETAPREKGAPSAVQSAKPVSDGSGASR